MSTEESKILEHEEDLARLEILRPMDDDFMRCIFKNNTPLVQKVLRILLKKPDLKIIKSETQVDMKRLVGARSICLDALGSDDEGKEYDIEIQREDKGAGQKRARYHSSVIDIENLNIGDDFDVLPETYVIFITEKDFFKKGLPFYAIERINISTGEPFNDGAHILYINGQYRGDDDIGRLMHDFSCNKADDMYDKDMADITRYYKETKEGQETVCKVMEDMREKARQEEHIRTRVIDIHNIMDTLKVSAEKAMDTLKIPVTERSKYQAML